MTPITLSASEAKLRFGETMKKVKEGHPVIIRKNSSPQMVWISMDDYEDFLEIKDAAFQKSLKKASTEIKKGNYGTLDDLYDLHRKTIVKESK